MMNHMVRQVGPRIRESVSVDRYLDNLESRPPAEVSTTAAGNQPPGYPQKMIEEANRNKDEFLGMLAHELRNPLAAVSMAVDVLRLSSPIDDPEQVCDVNPSLLSHSYRQVGSQLIIRVGGGLFDGAWVRRRCASAMITFRCVCPAAVPLWTADVPSLCLPT